MAVSGGVAAFAPRGRLPHISEAFRRVGIERIGSLVGLREGRMIKRARQVVAPLLGMCLIQLTRHTPIHFTIEARCRSIEICYGATG